MNMRTTALFDFSAPASENAFPSVVVSWKPGAADPIAGLSARAIPAPASAASRVSDAAIRRALMAILSFGRAPISSRGGLFRRQADGASTRRYRPRRSAPRVAPDAGRTSRRAEGDAGREPQ